MAVKMLCRSLQTCPSSCSYLVILIRTYLFVIVISHLGGGAQLSPEEAPVAKLFAGEACLKRFIEIYKWTEFIFSAVETNQEPPNPRRKVHDQVTMSAEKIKALIQNYGDLNKMVANPATRDAGHRILDRFSSYAKESEGEFQEATSPAHVIDAEQRLNMGEYLLHLRRKYLGNGRNVTRVLKEFVNHCVTMLHVSDWFPENVKTALQKDERRLPKLDFHKRENYRHLLQINKEISPILQIATQLQKPQWREAFPEVVTLTFEEGDENVFITELTLPQLDVQVLEGYHELLANATKFLLEEEKLRKLAQDGKEYHALLNTKMPAYLAQHESELTRVLLVLSSRLDKMDSKIQHFVANFEMVMQKIVREERILAEDAIALSFSFEEYKLVKKVTEDEYAKFYDTDDYALPEF